jgi:hypothetical protein
LQLFVARYDVFLFTGAMTYVASGPALWAWHRLRGHPIELFREEEDDDDEVDPPEVDRPRTAARG